MYTVTILTRLGFTDEMVLADTATDAINLMRKEWGLDAISFSARKSVYGEHECDISEFTIAGVHTHGKAIPWSK